MSVTYGDINDLLLEKPEGTTKSGQSRDTSKIGHKTQNKDKQNIPHRKMKTHQYQELHQNTRR